ncbi:hypothetical protein EVJ33_11215 [Exiguobacterium sp. SL-10]|nr:hypothetical protein EVJ33_11215 [Exiguobacterium sp. SL-10]
MNTSILNVRSSTSTASQIVGKLTKGSVVTVYSTSNNWAQIDFNGQKRYVSASYLSLKSASNQETAQPSKEYIAQENVNVRVSRTTSSSVITTIPKGSTVTYLASYGATGSWLKVSYNGKTGYVAARYFTIKDSSTVVQQSTSVNYAAKATVNLRSGTSTTASIIGSVPKGSIVSYISSHGASGSWMKIKYNGKTGYVAAAYFTKVSSGSTPSTPSSSSTHTTKEAVSLKQGTYSSAKTLTSIPSGAHVTLISLHGATGSWAKITYNKLTGYIPNRSLQSIEKQNTISLYTQRNTAVYKTKWTAGTVLKQLPLNTEVKQLSDLGSWIKVSVGSITGYIPKRDLAETKVVATITPYFAQQEALMYTSRWTSSKVIQTIPSGAKVEHLETYGTNKSWYKVRYANQTGYVASRNFALTPPVTEQYGTEREVQVVVANNGTLNVRTKPVDGDVIGTLANGTVVKVKPIVGSDWGLISYLLNGSLVKGYISLTYTKPYTPPVAGSKEMVITHTAYPYTLTSMIATQRNVFAQSDAYRTAYAYVPKAYITRATATATTGTVNSTELFTTSFQYLKATASSSATNLASLSTNTKLEYLGTQKVGSTTWFKVKSGLFTGYVSAANVAGNVKVLKDASMTAHSFGVLNPGEAVAITGEIGQYYTISYYRPSGYNIRVYDRAWRLATDEEITRQVSPTSFATTSREYFQFLDLSKSADLTATVLNKSLIGKGILAGRGQAFIDASRTHNVNEIYLLSHALLETGHGTSALATGTLVSTVDGKAVTPKTVYNMYGIGAIDGNAHVKGAERAYKEGWFTPEAAIIGGAKFIGDSYINNPNRKQNTLYKMRFNPSNPGTYQYATDISWATKQTANIYNMYQQLDAYTLYFEVPKFQ